jgi:anti-anti-sigma factor
MDVSETVEGDVTVVSVRGRLDSTTAPGFSARLAHALEEPKRRLLIDFSQLEYISSAGFRVLLLAARQASQTEGAIALSGVAGKVRQLFDLGGFLDLFQICGTRAEGLAALR